LWWIAKPTSPDPSSSPLIVYCAAGLKPPIERAAREYEKLYGGSIQVQYGGSGTLLSNLRVSRRGDLFLAADQSYLDIARTNGLVDEIVPLAYLTPVLAVRKSNPKRLSSMQDLVTRNATLAFANPEAAAIGKVTRDLL